MPRGFNLTQVQLELGHLVFARVTNVVLPQADHEPVTPFYGFAADVVTGDTIWFKRAQYSDRPIYLGPVRIDVPPRPDALAAVPKRNDIIVGSTYLDPFVITSCVAPPKNKVTLPLKAFNVLQHMVLLNQ